MKNLDASISNQGILDESVSNFTAKDLFSKEAIRAGLLSGTGVFGAAYEANRQDKLKAQKAAAEAEANTQAILAQAQSAVESAKAEAELAKSNIQIPNTSSAAQTNRTDDVRKFPWLLVSGITAGVLVLGTVAYLIFRKK